MRNGGVPMEKREIPETPDNTGYPLWMLLRWHQDLELRSRVIVKYCWNLWTTDIQLIKLYNFLLNIITIINIKYIVNLNWPCKNYFDFINFIICT